MTKAEYINLKDDDARLTPQERAYRAIQRANEKAVLDNLKRREGR